MTRDAPATSGLSQEAFFLAWHRLHVMPGIPSPFLLVPVSLVTFGGYRAFSQVSASGQVLASISASRFCLRCLRSTDTPDGEISSTELRFVRALREKALTNRYPLPTLDLTRSYPAWSGWKGNRLTSTRLARHRRLE